MHTTSLRTSNRQRLKLLRRASLAEATQKAYASDVRHYQKHHGVLPAKPNQVALYLAKWSQTHSCATLVRRMAALDRWHRNRGFASPVKTTVVQEAMRGIKRLYGGQQRQRQVRAITAKDLAKVVKAARVTQEDANPQASKARALRDVALVLLGFAAALRRSELVALEVGDLQWERAGLQLHIRRSKTDQFGQGQVVHVKRAKNGALCPIAAIRAWLSHAEIHTGSVFRSIDRLGRIAASALTPQSVALVLKRLATQALGEEAAADISGHSLRAGYCTDAARRGLSVFAIRQVTRHQSVETLGRYVRGNLAIA
ncbi:site-specific integrase [Diaphorobacter caeni]|uniref:site-specific integrase n=1 Tax=Diaphorobacter caeni TaxID=2784387 RepID=UPI00188F321D|nr:site-specific integrase [Diaphorobacter caeni]MBF5004754.1 tyrosine-type recombinase/integrase [Diaphorobacter caeni]